MIRLHSKAMHYPTTECDDYHCYSHGVDEWGGGYTRCFECWHLYRSKRELVWQWAKMHWRFGWRDGRPMLKLIGDILKKKADSISFCLHCHHDF